MLNSNELINKVKVYNKFLNHANNHVNNKKYVFPVFINSLNDYKFKDNNKNHFSDNENIKLLSNSSFVILCGSLLNDNQNKKHVGCTNIQNLKLHFCQNNNVNFDIFKKSKHFHFCQKF